MRIGMYYDNEQDIRIDIPNISCDGSLFVNFKTKIANPLTFLAGKVNK